MVFFGEIHGLLKISCIYLFGTKRAYVHLETPKLQEVFLSKTNSILTGKKCARFCDFKQRWFSLERYMCFFNSDV
jgi:hypothetical protein